MPTNVTAEYLVAEKEYREATTIEEKIRALQRMISNCPKHKGTEKLLKELKEKLAKLRKERERIKKTKKGRQEVIAKEGAAQVVIIGFTNVGKSLLLKTLTNAEPKVSDYPFTTIKPEQGMIDFEGAKVQLVDTPSLIEEVSSENDRNRQILGIARNSDLLLLMGRSKEEIEKLVKLIGKYGIIVNKKRPNIVVNKIPAGIKINGKELVETKKDLYELLEDIGIKNCEIIIKEKCSEEEFLLALEESVVFKPALLVVNKALYQGREVDQKENKNGEEKLIYIDIKKEEDKKRLKEIIWKKLGLVRVYTKEPGKDPKMDLPIVIKKGSTLREVALQLHKDFVNKFSYARVWGKSVKFPGQRVGIEHVPEDKDIVEVHLKK